MSTGEVRTGEETLLEYSDDGGSTWTELVKVISLQPPGWTRAAVSKTHLRSSYKKYRPGKIPDFGTISFRVQASKNNPGYLILQGMYDDLTDYRFRLSYYDEFGQADGTDAFDGFVTEFQPDTAEDEANFEADVTLQVNSEVVSTT